MANRSTTPAPKQPAKLTSVQKRAAISSLERQIAKLRNFDINSINAINDPRISVQSQAVDTTLVNIFGAETLDYERYQWASLLRSPVMYLGEGPSISEVHRELAAGKQKAIAILEGIVERFQEELAVSQESSEPTTTTTDAAKHPKSRRIFVVHGHDEGPREAVARFLETIGFQPIILHEQPNRGRTVIEKVETHGDVGFAVVLLTPDDEGCLKGETLQPRPWQNVLLELGYFIGKLGREFVCALKKGDMEIPSDFGGVVWESFDGPSGGWKTKLGKELEAAGFEIDWNKVMRS